MFFLREYFSQRRMLNYVILLVFCLHHTYGSTITVASFENASDIAKWKPANVVSLFPQGKIGAFIVLLEDNPTRKL